MILFILSHARRTRGHLVKLNSNGFKLDKKKYFKTPPNNLWNSLPLDITEAKVTFDRINTHVCMYVGTLILYRGQKYETQR